MPPDFAVILADDAEFDAVKVGKLLAEPLDIPLVDLIARLAITRGILAEGLTESEAKRCEAFLLYAGIAARVVASDALVDPPPACVLRSASFSDGELTYATIPEQAAVSEGAVTNKRVPWSEFLWLDCVSVQRLEHEEFQDWKVGSQGENEPRVTRFKSQRLKTERPLQIDLVSKDPWLWLQIRDDSFQFGATNLAVQPNRRENMHHLAIAMGLRATAARLGPGMQWFRDRTALRETRMVNAVVHGNHLRWQLTRLELDSHGA